jgi:tetratricopeptide (TPR) repeat protein
MRHLALLLALAAPLSARPQGGDPVAASSPASRAPPAGRVAPSTAVSVKLAEGDRLSEAGDPRNALFAYLDAVYAQPAYLASRVKVGRAYLTLRYPGRAIEQAELVLAAEPDDADAKKLLEDAKAAAARIGPSPQAAPGAATPGASGAAAVAAPAVAGAAPGGAAPQAAPALVADAPKPAAPRAAPRVYKLTPEPAVPSAPASGAHAAAPVAVAAATPVDRSAAERGAQHYRTALGMLKNREWANAIGELTSAIEADPKLAVAWSARGSAQFGLGKYKEAAEDYRHAVSLDGKLGTPVYGLAECYRQLGDRAKAAEAYQKYADSKASDVRDDLRALALKRAHEMR